MNHEDTKIKIEKAIPLTKILEIIASLRKNVLCNKDSFPFGWNAAIDAILIILKENLIIVKEKINSPSL